MRKKKKPSVLATARGGSRTHAMHYNFDNVSAFQQVPAAFCYCVDLFFKMDLMLVRVV